MSTWTKKELLLIAAVKKYPAIYQRGQKKFAVSKDCWKLIAAELNEPENKCRSKWTKIRSCYGRAKRIKSQKAIQFSKYLDKNLKFLAPQIKRRNGTTNKGITRKKRSDNELFSDDYDNMLVVTQIVSEDPSIFLAQELHSQHSSETEAESLLPNEESGAKDNIDIKEQPAETTLELDEKKFDACVTQPVQSNGTNDEEQFKVAVKVEPHTDGIECESSDGNGLLAQSNTIIHSMKIEIDDNFDIFDSSSSKLEHSTDLCEVIKPNPTKSKPTFNGIKTYSRKRMCNSR